ncbi:MAG: radical SAM protein [Acidobacteriota bacterium]
MKRKPFSLILLPTLACNADCEYCFEAKAEVKMTHGQLSVLVRKVMDHMEENRIEKLHVYWQGGEVMTMPPEWFQRADELIQRIAADSGCEVSHYLQSNMVAYSSRWNPVLAEMFGNSVGTSMDYPNLHRRLKNGSLEDYGRVWERNVRKAREAGIEVGVISIPNEGTFEIGADRFYSYFTEELGISDFQINTPFPGGAMNDAKMAYPLDNGRLSGFLRDLGRIWVERGYSHGVRVGPFDRLVNYFLFGNRDLLCIWGDNCSNDFICIDPGGNVAQCDCWVTSYPDYRFGNLLASNGLSEMLRSSPVRQSLLSRPGTIVLNEDCLECGYLSVCHGGCPVRAFSVHGDLSRKDPYCELYQSLFRDVEDLAMMQCSGMAQGAGI